MSRHFYCGDNEIKTTVFPHLLCVIVVTADESHRDKSTLKFKVPRNMYAIFLTLDVIQDDMSPLNFAAYENMALISSTFDVYQSVIELLVTTL